MKIKLRTDVTYSYTLASPYPDEVGRHKHESVIACCGNCGKSIEQAHFYHSWDYCPYCGEAIDWPENESSHRAQPRKRTGHDERLESRTSSYRSNG